MKLALKNEVCILVLVYKMILLVGEVVCVSYV
jgi:hypothetical protein